jgi:hypothetical protein
MTVSILGSTSTAASGDVDENHGNEGVESEAENETKFGRFEVEVERRLWTVVDR